MSRTRQRKSSRRNLAAQRAVLCRSYRRANDSCLDPESLGVFYYILMAVLCIPAFISWAIKLCWMSFQYLRNIPENMCSFCVSLYYKKQRESYMDWHNRWVKCLTDSKLTGFCGLAFEFMKLPEATKEYGWEGIELLNQHINIRKNPTEDQAEETSRFALELIAKFERRKECWPDYELYFCPSCHDPTLDTGFCYEGHKWMDERIPVSTSRKVLLKIVSEWYRQSSNFEASLASHMESIKPYNLWINRNLYSRSLFAEFIDESFEDITGLLSIQEDRIDDFGAYLGYLLDSASTLNKLKVFSQQADQVLHNGREEQFDKEHLRKLLSDHMPAPVMMLRLFMSADANTFDMTDIEGRLRMYHLLMYPIHEAMLLPQNIYKCYEMDQDLKKSRRLLEVRQKQARYLEKSYDKLIDTYSISELFEDQHLREQFIDGCVLCYGGTGDCKMKQCSKCAARYCSKECQTDDWERHKTRCVKARKQRSKRSK